MLQIYHNLEINTLNRAILSNILTKMLKNPRLLLIIKLIKRSN